MLLRRRLASRGFDLSSLDGGRNIVAVLSAAMVNSTVQAALLGTAEQTTDVKSSSRNWKRRTQG